MVLSFGLRCFFIITSLHTYILNNNLFTKHAKALLDGRIKCLFILEGGTQQTAAERKHGLERTEPDVNLADISNPHYSTAERV